MKRYRISKDTFADNHAEYIAECQSVPTDIDLWEPVPLIHGHTSNPKTYEYCLAQIEMDKAETLAKTRISTEIIEIV